MKSPPPSTVNKDTYLSTGIDWLCIHPICPPDQQPEKELKPSAYYSQDLIISMLLIWLQKQQRRKSGVIKIIEQKRGVCQSMTQPIRVNLRNAIKSLIRLPGNRSGQINTILHTATHRFTIWPERERKPSLCVPSTTVLSLLSYSHTHTHTHTLHLGCQNDLKCEGGT